MGLQFNWMKQLMLQIVLNYLYLLVALEATTKGEDIFENVESFFKQHGLNWKDMKGCTTDGAQVSKAVSWK